MSIDLNQVAKKLRLQQGLGVKKTGELTPTDPKNDGAKITTGGNTTLEPKRFFQD